MSSGIYKILHILNCAELLKMAHLFISTALKAKIKRKKTLARFKFGLYTGVFLFSVFCISSCFTVKYSTSGASIPPEMKTVSIAYFPNRSNDVKPTLSQEITEKLREKIRQNTSLKVITDGGDAMFEGEITGYTIQPVSIQSGDVAAKNRLTITVKVKFTNNINSEFSFDTSFSRYEDYDSNQSADWAAANLHEKIVDNITEDIFNKAFVNW